MPPWTFLIVLQVFGTSEIMLSPGYACCQTQVSKVYKRKKDLDFGEAVRYMVYCSPITDLAALEIAVNAPSAVVCSVCL
jgi:hypothetical protein